VIDGVIVGLSLKGDFRGFSAGTRGESSESRVAEAIFAVEGVLVPLARPKDKVSGQEGGMGGQETALGEQGRRSGLEEAEQITSENGVAPGPQAAGEEDEDDGSLLYPKGTKGWERGEKGGEGCRGQGLLEPEQDCPMARGLPAAAGSPGIL
jgi:hypothetical protein